ncbi:MAG: hypothetical protein QF464_03720 [Myxococcota bacterium]|jgi:hypothetical protein|nr:hypothetical protein [Myxococcota bacterium]
MQTTALALILLALGQTGPAGPVLPSSATQPLRTALATEEARLDGRLMLGSALLDTHTVTVAYVKERGGEPVITVVLGHPDQKAGGVKAGPFVVLSSKGEDEAALAALVSRLEKLTVDEIWNSRAEEDKADRPETSTTGSVTLTDAERRAVRSLWSVDHAIVLGDLGTAKELLDGMSAEPDLPVPTLLDVADRYQRAKALDQVKATLGRWKTGTVNDIVSPVDSARAAVLGGDAVSVLKVLQDARVSGNECGFDELAETLDAMGQRVEGYQLLDTAARKTDCPRVETTMLEWLVADGRQSEARELSGVLAQHDPGNLDVAAIRARILLAAEQDQAVVDLLEPLAKRSPEGALLGIYMHARLRLADGATELATLSAKSDANIEDALTALAAAIAHHHHGDDEAAQRYIERTGDVYADQRIATLLRARLAFNHHDRAAVGRILDELEAGDMPGKRGVGGADTYALRGELLRWTDHEAARDALQKAVLVSARQLQSPALEVRRMRAQIAALDACVEEGTKPPCPGPFVHPRGHDSNAELGAAPDEDQNVFGHGLTIFGVMLIFLVIVRQGRKNKRRASRW